MYLLGVKFPGNVLFIYLSGSPLCTTEVDATFPGVHNDLNTDVFFRDHTEKVKIKQKLTHVLFLSTIITVKS